MEFSLTRNWWLLALRGVLAILFGVAAFFWPGLFWAVVVYTFAAYALIDGVLAIAAAVAGHGRGGTWWALLLEGLVGIAAGVVTFAWPLAAALTGLVLLYLIAFQAIATGVFEVVAAVRLRKHIRNEWLLGLSGVLSVLFGVALALAPVEGAVVVAWWVAAYAVAFGTLMLAVAFRLRAWPHQSRAWGNAAAS